MKDTTEAFFEACNQVSWHAVLSQEFSDRKLHQDLYQEIRSTWGLKAQMACSVFRTVSARYKHDHVQERCKRRERGVYLYRRSMPLQLGRDWSLREIKHADGSKKIMFSISTLHGRVLVDGKIGAFQQRYLDDGWRPARAMLVCRGEEIWLQISIEKEAPAVQSLAALDVLLPLKEEDVNVAFVMTRSFGIWSASSDRFARTSNVNVGSAEKHR